MMMDVYAMQLRQKKSNALVFAKKHAALLGLNLRSTMRVSAHVTHDLTDMLNSWVRVSSSFGLHQHRV
jgi:hypothetical protein